MATTKGITKKVDTSAVKAPSTLSLAINSAAVQQRFEKMLGENAGSFLSSVLTVCNNNKLLRAADYRTILAAAATAASLKLSVTPDLGEAYIVPRGGQACYQTGTVNYDFAGVEMPEGYELSADEQGRFVDVIKGMNLSNDQARALAKYGTEYASRVVQGVEQLRAQEIAKWGDEAKTALGADLGKVQGLCDTACRKLEAMYPGLNVREALEVTGAGNQIAIVRAFAKLGELLGEDPGLAAQNGAQGLNAAQGIAANMYPKTDWSRYK